MEKPKIRFPEYSDYWISNKFDDILIKHSEPVKVELNKEYRQIGIRSHCKGIFHKDEVKGEILGNKRVFWIVEDALIINIVFAWEQAIAKTSEKELGMIASHRFPMYLPFEGKSNIDFLLSFFHTEKGKHLLQSASPGGAGRNKTLGQKNFDNSTILIPHINEQTKIASFLSTIDEKLTGLKEKKALLEEYKKGMMQKLFSQEVRFKDDTSIALSAGNGKDFADWEEKSLGEICNVNKGTQLNRDLLSDSQIYPSISGGIKPSGYTSEYNRNENTIIISEGGNSCGYVNFITTKFWCGGHCYSIDIKDNSTEINYLYQILKYNQEQIMRLRVGSGLPNIQKKDLLKFAVLTSKTKEEQTKIANFLSAIDEKIELVNTQIDEMQVYKKGLLQGMFC